MKVTILKPSEQLKSIVSSYTIIETAELMNTTVLPHLGLVLAIQLSGKVSLQTQNKTVAIAPITISGQRNTFRSFRYEPNTTTILVSFTETGAHSIFRDAVFELYEHAESLENLIPFFSTDEFIDKLSSSDSNQERIEMLQAFLLKEVRKAQTDKLILSAVEKIHYKKGAYKIKELSAALNISQDAFEKRFRKVVGSTPKQFSSVVKMKEVIKHKNASKPLTDLVYSFDFFDQSHFIKQFKAFAGQTPKEFFRQRYTW